MMTDAIIAEARRRGTTALDQWRKEITAGLRTASAPLDNLWRAACREASDAEFEREVGAPQRQYVRQLQERHR